MFTDMSVPAFWADLGLPGLADVHIHFLPERMLEKVWGHFDRYGEVAGQPWTITYRDPEPQRLATIRALGVRAVPALVYPHKPGMVQWLNDWCAEFAARVPDAVHCGTLYPDDGITEETARAIEAGARLFKVHIQVGNFAPDDPRLIGAWGLLADARIPVVIHCGSGPFPGPHTGIGPVRRLLAAVPGLTLIIAHAGLPELDEFADLAAAHPTVYLDTTMLGTDYLAPIAPITPDYRARLADLGDKVVLGSDFPNIPYPYAHQIEALARLDLGDDWLRNVLWHNGARLLGLSA